MKLFSALACAVLAAQQVVAHYRFIGINGSGDYDYIRLYDNVNSNGPVTNVASADIVCNLGAVGRTTGTLTIAAGSTVSLCNNAGSSNVAPHLTYVCIGHIQT